jgi:hypothetical protein
VKLFLFLFGPVNLHSDSWILQLKKSEWLVGQKVFHEDWWQRPFFFPHYQSHIIITTTDLSIVKNASQTDRRVTVFHWPAKVWYPVYGMNKFYKPKIEFPQSEFHCQMANKRKKDIFETLSVPLLDYYTPHNKIVGGYTGFTMSVRPSVDKSYVVR